jgi:hypothetical protein
MKRNDSTYLIPAPRLVPVFCGCPRQLDERRLPKTVDDLGAEHYLIVSIPDFQGI